MGPPLISGGNNLYTPGIPDESISFNGAAADQRRKFEHNAVTTAGVAASMGPPLISGGNEHPAHGRLFACLLQWGRR